MKKLLKVVGVVLLILAVVFLVMGLTQPKDITVVRSIVIKAPQSTVFHQISKFTNWPNWSPWIDIEPEVNLSYEGVDGQPGSSYTWLGDETGSGKMTNTGIENGQLNFDLHFIKPWEGKAIGFLKTEITPAQETKVIWSLTIHSSFPMNAIGFITRNMVGNDFTHGLQLLKTYTESHPVAALGLSDVVENEFPATSFASIRKKVLWTEMKDFSSNAFKTLLVTTEGRKNGPPCTFYFDWNISEQSSDLAPAFAVTGSAPIPGAEMINIPAMHVCSVLHKGGYASLGKAQEILGKYIFEKGKNLNYTYEEYIVGPANEADSNKWVTNVIFLVD